MPLRLQRLQVHGGQRQPRLRQRRLRQRRLLQRRLRHRRLHLRSLLTKLSGREALRQPFRPRCQRLKRRQKLRPQWMQRLCHTRQRMRTQVLRQR